MPHYTREEIEEMLKKVEETHKDWTSGRWKDEHIEFMAKYPSMLRQLLDEREEMRRKIEGMRRENAGMGDSCSFHHGSDAMRCDCEAFNEAILEVLALFNE